MKILCSGAALALLLLAPPARADERPKAGAKTYQVPYRLTLVKHVLVRAKINGKGPYNFILDTGAPALFVSKAVAKKLGVKPDKDGWGTFDRFEIEGGVVVPKAKGVIDDPFQLEGMNGLGLAGAELHGVIGFNVLARYRMEIDFTKDKMTWTALDYKPMELMRLGNKAGGGNLEMIGTLMKALGGMLGRKANPDVVARGFLGVELADGGEHPVVKAVLDKGPAARGGVKAGDTLTKFQGRTVTDTADVDRFLRKLTPGQEVKLTVLRDGTKHELRCKIGEGL
jgi:hypothetical protein